MNKFLIIFIIFFLSTSYLVKAQHPATQVLQASTSAVLNINQLIAQSRQQLQTIYRQSEIKLREIHANRNLNETLRAQELVAIRRILKSQLANWRQTLNEKIAFLERDMQNAVDLIFERPVNNNVYIQ